MAEDNEPESLRFDPETGRLMFYWPDRPPEDVEKDRWCGWADLFPQYAPSKGELVFLFRHWHQEMMWSLWKYVALGADDLDEAYFGLFCVARLSRLAGFLGKEVAERLITEEACCFKKMVRESFPSSSGPGIEQYRENTFEKNWERFLAHEDFNVMTRDFGVLRPDAAILASCDGNTRIEKLDIVADPRWDAVQGYVPTWQELVWLLRHWYGLLVTARWDGGAKGVEAGERLRSFAARITKIACLLGEERTEEEMGEMMASFEDEWEMAALTGKRRQAFRTQWQGFVAAGGFEVATGSLGTLRPDPLTEEAQWSYDLMRQAREGSRRKQEATA